MFTNITTLFLFLAPIAALIATVCYAVRLVRSGHSAKSAITRQLCAIMAVGVILCITAAALPASAADTSDVPAVTDAAGDKTTEDASPAEAESEHTSGSGFAEGMAYLAAAMVTSLSGIGGGIAVAAGAPAAIGATSENPKAFGKSLIFVALGEGIALYGLLVSILILSNV